jgi:hypothetical protein
MADKAMVAVCDILGFSNLVKEKPLKEILDLHIPNFHSLLKAVVHTSSGVLPSRDEIIKNGYVGSAVFSDTVLIYSLIDELAGYHNVLVAVYALLAMPLQHPELRFRIGVSYGEFYHDPDNNIYVGKALIDAYELEKIQEWCGGALTKTAEDIIGSGYATTRDILVTYNIPVKSDSLERKIETYTAINWTQAKHEIINSEYFWLERDYLPPLTAQQEKIERKLKNTERFHYDICVQCRAHRKRK